MVLQLYNVVQCSITTLAEVGVCCEVSTKSSKCKLNASCNSAFNASLVPLHAAPCSFFLLFFSCPEETEDLHKQQSSIAKIACRLINAPQLIRAVAMNHNQPHADSAETNCPTSVHQTHFSWKRVWLCETNFGAGWLHEPCSCLFLNDSTGVPRTDCKSESIPLISLFSPGTLSFSSTDFNCASQLLHKYAFSSLVSTRLSRDIEDSFCICSFIVRHLGPCSFLRLLLSLARVFPHKQQLSATCVATSSSKNFAGYFYSPTLFIQ